MFEIEKNVPIPEKAIKSKYPFHQMEVGDSFAVPKEKFKAATASGYDFVKRSKGKGIKFHFSRTHLRIWRIS